MRSVNPILQDVRCGLFLSLAFCSISSAVRAQGFVLQVIPPQVNVCSDTTAAVAVRMLPFGGFSDSVLLTAPQGAFYTVNGFVPNPLIPNGGNPVSATAQIYFSPAAAGVFEIPITGTPILGGLPQTVIAAFGVGPPIQGEVLSGYAPKPTQTDIGLRPRFAFTSIPTAVYNVSLDDDGMPPALESFSASESDVRFATVLEPNTGYTFAATASNSCDNTNTLVVNASTAQACYFVDQAIPDNGVLESTFTVVGNTIQDLRLTLGIDHPRVGDLKATLSRLDRSAVVFDRPGFPDAPSGCDKSNVEVVLRDGASVAAETLCEPLGPALAGPVTPDDPMSGFDGVSAAGDWILTIEDLASGQAGQLVEWCLSSGAAPADRLSPMGYTVTPLAGSSGALSPSTPQAVLHGNRVTFTATPDPGFGVASVSGCDGSLSGTTYTTGVPSPLTARCWEVFWKSPGRS